MNKAEWELVEKKLSPLGGCVDLMCDGYKVSLQMQRVSKYRFAIMVYVGGHFRGEWLIKDCEERRRFLCEGRKCLLRGKKKSELLKLYRTKKEKERVIEEFTVTTYASHWGSLSALRRHFEKNNQVIEYLGAEF